MKLEDLLKDLEKEAGFVEDMKDKKEDSKDDKKDDKKSDEKKDDSRKDDGEGDDKKKDEKKDDQEKSAAFKSGQDLANEIMEKVAATKTQQTQGEDMNKQASDAGKALAQALLTKLAGVNDVSTSNGIPAGVVPNKTQQDLAQQVAEHDAVIQATPGTDGAGNGGTINQIFDAIVADAQARTNAVTSGQTPSAPAEGAVVAAQVPAQVAVAAPSAIGDGQEKAAAVSALVNSGIDFDEAVNLVKQASDELEAEHATHVKQAALNELLDAGISFDYAVSLVKQLSV